MLPYFITLYVCLLLVTRISAAQRYYLYKQEKTWIEAQQFCTEHHGTLARLESVDDEHDLMNDIKNKLEKRSWIGGVLRDDGWHQMTGNDDIPLYSGKGCYNLSGIFQMRGHEVEFTDKKTILNKNMCFQYCYNVNDLTHFALSKNKCTCIDHLSQTRMAQVKNEEVCSRKCKATPTEWCGGEEDFIGTVYKMEDIYSEIKTAQLKEDSFRDGRDCFVLTSDGENKIFKATTCTEENYVRCHGSKKDEDKMTWENANKYCQEKHKSLLKKPDIALEARSSARWFAIKRKTHWIWDVDSESPVNYTVARRGDLVNRDCIVIEPIDGKLIELSAWSCRGNRPFICEEAPQYTYLGCYGDQKERTMSGYEGYNISGLTQERCARICTAKKFLYFGVEIGRECYCDNKKTKYSTGEEDNCSFKCEGNPTQTCGGNWKLSVFAIEVKAPKYSYVGCYVDKEERVMTGYEGYDIIGVTPELCAKICKARNFLFFGIEVAKECFCDNSYSRYGKADESSCTFYCPENRKQTCGGDWRLSVYAIHKGNESEERSYPIIPVSPTRSGEVFITTVKHNDDIEDDTQTGTIVGGIVGIVLFLSLIVILLLLYRRYGKKRIRDPCSSPANQQRPFSGNVYCDTAENITYYDTADMPSDRDVQIVNHPKPIQMSEEDYDQLGEVKTINTASGNIYSHANMGNDLYEGQNLQAVEPIDDQEYGRLNLIGDDYVRKQDIRTAAPTDNVYMHAKIDDNLYETQGNKDPYNDDEYSQLND